MTTDMTLEICCGSYVSAMAAKQAGAQRVELCSGLSEGGLTPSIGLIRAVCAIPGIVHHVLIRPRSGDFLYSIAEKDIIISDITAAVDAGADGVVVGALTADGAIDVPFLHDCVKAAQGRNVTFHRAFDLCASPFESICQIADAGCSRILTSGLAATAQAGIPMLCRLTDAAPDGLSIMAGCGVNAGNVARIIRETGVREVHASARVGMPSLMRFCREGVNMGRAGDNEYATLETSVEVVRQLLEQIQTPMRA